MNNSLLRSASSILSVTAAAGTLIYAMTVTLTPFMALIGIPLLLLAIATAGLLAQRQLDRHSSSRATEPAEYQPEQPARRVSACRQRRQADCFSTGMRHQPDTPSATKATPKQYRTAA